MRNLATVSDDDLLEMRDKFAVYRAGATNPTNEADRHMLESILPMMIALLNEVLSLRGWQRQMVEKAASGGVLDGYRELGAKCAALEAELDRLRAAAEAHGDALQRAATAAGLLAGDDMHTMLVPAIERLRAYAETERDWTAIDAAIRQYLDDYELIGEDDDGADACYTPTQRERVLIHDAINGLLADEHFMGLIATRRAPFDLISHIEHARAFSERTFGPGARTAGVIAHIRKELAEIEAAPDDLSEWIDVVILALDGAWRAGYSAEQIVDALAAKQMKNEARKWPDWRTAPADGPIEHVREETQR